MKDYSLVFLFRYVECVYFCNKTVVYMENDGGIFIVGIGSI